MSDMSVARAHMVEGQVRTSDVTDKRITDIMGRLERERFVPADKRALAYACHRRSLQRLERLVHAAEESTANGAEKVREVIHGMLIDSERNGPLLYFGDYSYLDAAQRIAIADSADRLKNTVEQFIRKGMKDGSVVECEPELIVQLLLGMLIWLGKWVPSIPDITVDRLMSAIDAFSFYGLASRAVTGSKRRR